MARTALMRGFAVAVLCLALAAARVDAARNLLAATTATNTTFLVFFGDSLTATGGKSINMRSPSLDPVTGYAPGRWSNGPVWADFVNQNMAAAGKTSMKNYAVGGATACKTSSLFLATPQLTTQTSTFQADVKSGALPSPTNTAGNRVLAFQFIGANDVGAALTTSFFRGDNWFTTQAQTTIACRMANIDAIVAAGYKDIVVLPVPSVGAAPLYNSMVSDSDAIKLVDAMNTELAAQVAARQATYDAAPAGSALAGTRLYLIDGVATGDSTMPFPITDRACWGIPPFVGVVTAQIAPMYTKCTDPQDFAYFDNLHPTTAYHGWFVNDPAGLMPVLKQLGLAH